MPKPDFHVKGEKRFHSNRGIGISCIDLVNRPDFFSLFSVCFGNIREKPYSSSSDKLSQ